MPNIESLTFVDNKAAQTTPEKFTEITVDCAKVFKSWKGSVYSFEWLNADGSIKSIDELSEAEAEKRKTVETALGNNDKIEKPVLGIGMMDNIEIGSGRATFLTLYDHGLKTLNVHVRTSGLDDFKDFVVKP